MNLIPGVWVKIGRRNSVRVTVNEDAQIFDVIEATIKDEFHLSTFPEIGTSGLGLSSIEGSMRYMRSDHFNKMRKV